MKATLYFSLSFIMLSFAVTGQNDAGLRGPQNMLDGGIVDGVVIKDELPVRSKVEYEHVRLADYVWSKRVFSRIDARERINHDLFLPYDYFPQEVNPWSPPTKPEEIDKSDWLKHQERWSLWTIIFRHIMLGDLTVYEVADKNFGAIEDGYSFKYPIKKSTPDAYFSDPVYRKQINRKLSYGGKGPDWSIQGDDQQATPTILMKNDSTESFDDWFVRVTTKGVVPDFDPDYFGALTRLPNKDKVDLKMQYTAADVNVAIKRPDVVQYISSQSITAYNIKEDWFFDKERSMLDRRIIAIAPVGRVAYDDSSKTNDLTDDGIDRFKTFISVNRNGELISCAGGSGSFEPYKGQYIEKELFWLYFPELRNVIVNYYVYNDQNDAQWMSMDDLFWKRKFSATIYKVSDKFDREIQDYKFGVDALYEAERIKEEIRTWEHDVWNF
jgi:hypothetical protein